MEICKVSWCNRPKHAKGFCSSHYDGARAGRDPENVIPRQFTNALDGFWNRIDKREPTECWPWIGALNPSGYGKCSEVGANTRLAHRSAYILLRGQLPDGMSLDHICHNQDVMCPPGKDCRHRRCCNPDHMIPATRPENTASGKWIEWRKARNAAQTHCKHGHEFTPENTLIQHKKNSINGHPYTARYCRACMSERRKARK